MNKERIIWWLFFIPFALAMVLAIMGVISLATIISFSPEASAFLLGFIGFWLFANRLIFGYGGIADAIYQFKKGVPEENIINKKELAKKTNRALEELQKMSFISLILLWKSWLEPFRYAFYLAFFLILITVEIFNVGGDIGKAFLLGSSFSVILAWGMEMLAAAAFTDYNLLEEK